MPRSGWYEFRPYVTAAEKRARASRELARLAKRTGQAPEPVVVDGRKIAKTFWGKAWCDNLESYADLAYRLERGRSYVRGGAVIDLQIAAGKIAARVSGTDLYSVEIEIERLARRRWKTMAGTCAGKIASLVGLLRGELPDEVMRAVTDRASGLFPEPRQIRMSCSCPDWAEVCKHVAASLYGVGARLDARPELLFHLRGVDVQDLIHQAATSIPATSSSATLPDADLGALFGIELAPAKTKKRPPQLPAAVPADPRAPARTPRGRPSRRS